MRGQTLDDLLTDLAAWVPVPGGSRVAEALTLSRTVRRHCEHRVLLNGNGTVVFR